jgi:hypothetical protein
MFLNNSESSNVPNMQYFMNQQNLLCKKMNLQCCKNDCNRSHSIDELIITNCHHGDQCKNCKCPFVHPFDSPITKQKYYHRMYDYISPYESNKTTVCRYYEIGCKIEKCKKAHNIKELTISNCDCFRDECPFYHQNRDKNITKQEYFDRIKSWVKTLKKSDKNLICRYINIGCQRADCPYAHNIRELNVHNCIFKDCKSYCVFLHNGETIDKQEYFDRMLDYIKPILPKTVLCYNSNCKYNKCLYAHSYNDLIITECIRGNKCKKHCCPFKHPQEFLNKNTYYNRMKIARFPN